MAAGEKGHKHPVDEIFLTDDYLAEFTKDFLPGLAREFDHFDVGVIYGLLCHGVASSRFINRVELGFRIAHCHRCSGPQYGRAPRNSKTRATNP